MKTDSQSFVLQLFGLDMLDVESINYVPEGCNALIKITLTDSHPPCPYCGYEKVKIKNYVLKRIKHSQLSDRACTLEYRARRYVCPICSRSFYENNPFVFKSMKISIKTVYNILDDLKNHNETFSSVANRYHISPTTVASIFDTHVDIPRKQLPKRINIDEVYAFKSKESKYVCVLLDYDTQTPIDILPSRRKEYLLNYFKKIPKEEREKVEICCFDMYPIYRDVFKEVFPNIVCTADHYHVSQELHRKLDSVRIRVMKGCRCGDDDYYLLKKFNWILFKHNDDKLFDPSKKREYNTHFQRYLNYYELRELLLCIHPDLTEAYLLKDEVVDFYKNSNIDTAPSNITDLIVKFKKCKVPEMNLFSKTLSNWRNEIINSFNIVGRVYKVDTDNGDVSIRDKKMNNSIAENRNSIIKTMKKNSNGFNNWYRFRNRVLYVLDKTNNYMMMPTFKPKKIQKGKN